MATLNTKISEKVTMNMSLDSIRINVMRLFLVTALAILPLGLHEYSSTTINAQQPITINVIAWSLDGSKIATGYSDGVLKVWNITNSQAVSLEQTTQPLYSLAWRYDGKQILGRGDSTAWVWDVDTGEIIAELPDVSPSIVGAVSWTADNTQIMTFGFDTGRTLWTADTFHYIATDDKAGTVAQITWQNNNSQVIVAAGAGASIIDPITFETIVSVVEPEEATGARAAVFSAALSTNGELIATGNFAGVVRLWDANNGNHLRDLQATDSSLSDRNITPVLALTFNETATQLTSISVGGTLRTWNTDNGVIQNSQQLDGSPLYAAAFSPDGTKLAYAGSSGAMSIAPVSNGVGNATQTVVAGDVTGLINAINAANANADASVIGVEGTLSNTYVGTEYMSTNS